MKTKILIQLILILVLIFGFLIINKRSKTLTNKNSPSPTADIVNQNPLSISYMQNQKYPGTDIAIESALNSGSNYKQYIASYKSDGLKIYALLTIPNTNPPAGGYPVIIFNHGFIDPSTYTTTGNYVAYVDALSRAGYVVFKPDYRGHGNSEGNARGGYSYPDYTIDVLSALSSIQKYKGVNPNKIGMWGHSMGGQMTLRSLVVLPNQIKAAVIWSGVIAPYKDLLENWHHSSSYDSVITQHLGSLKNTIVKTYGTPESNPAFWNEISPNTYVKDINAPVDLFAAQDDPEVPVSFSQTLNNELKSAGNKVSLTIYPDDNHNLSNNFSDAMGKTIEFFNKYLK